MKASVLIGVFGLCLLLRLGAVGLVDYDEALYAEISRSMRTSGQYLVPELDGRPFFEKPPLLYWSQAAGYALFGENAFGARVFNALAAVAAVASLYGFARGPLSARVACLAAFAMGSSLGFFLLGRFAVTDMLLTLWLILCLGCLHRAFESGRLGESRGALWLLAAGIASGLAALTKGAIGFALPAAAAAAHLAGARSLRAGLRLRWIAIGVAGALTVGLSWYLWLGLNHSLGFSLLRELVLEQQVNRFTTPIHGHGGPFYYYLPVLLIGFLPWSPLLILGFRRGALGDLSDERGRFLRLMLLFSAACLIFFSAAATKLPTYLLPALPGAAVWVADRLARGTDPAQGAGRDWYRAWTGAAVTLLLLAVALAAAPRGAEALPGLMGENAGQTPGLTRTFSLGLGPYLAAVAALVGALVALAWRKRRSLAPAVALGACALLAWSALCQLLLPRLDAHFQAPLRALAAAAAERTPDDKRIALVGLRRRPSVIFYGGRGTVYRSRRRPEQIAQLFADDEARVGITSESYYEEIRGRIPLEALARDTGYVLFGPAGDRRNANPRHAPLGGGSGGRGP